MNKSLLITGLVVGSIIAYRYLTQRVLPKAEQFLKDHISVAISGFRVHKISWGGIELRLTADFINLMALTAKCSKIKADIYYLNNGSPSPLATTTFNQPFTIKAKDTTRIRDIKAFASTLEITKNLSILTAKQRQFKIVLTCTVNGQELKLIQNTVA